MKMYKLSFYFESKIIVAHMLKLESGKKIV